jgi:dihydrofolate reductase
MKVNGPTVILHVVSSLDGFIARHDNDVSWLDSPADAYEPGVPEDSAEDMGDAIGCFVLGSHTYEHALQLGWPYGDIPTVVTTTRELPSTRKSVEFYSGDLRKLIDEILAPRFKNVWLVGGAVLCQSFLRLGLVNEISLSIAPVLLGDGLRLFGNAATEERWHLNGVVAYKTGFVELSYRKRINRPLILKRSSEDLVLRYSHLKEACKHEEPVRCHGG